MNSINVYVEVGKKRTIVSAVDWPGWCRWGRDEKSALQAFIDYGARYAGVLQGAAIELQTPADVTSLVVTDRLEGNATTDFGAPAVIPAADRAPIERKDLDRSQTILRACWQTFDGAVRRATGRELRKGPRGGGRDLEKIVWHVLEADKAYLRRLAWKRKGQSGEDLFAELKQTRQAILNALEAALEGNLPTQGPRGGVVWPPRYFVRRVAYHVLDHAWEIEDRIV